MAVKILTNKRIIQYNEKNPNFVPQKEEKKKPIVNGNLKENYEEDIYGENEEKVHTYQPDNGNLQMTELMTGLFNKLDNKIDGLNVNPDIVKKNRAIEVDIKREIAIGDVDVSAVKSEKINHKVNNSKLNKLKALRQKRK